MNTPPSQINIVGNQGIVNINSTLTGVLQTIRNVPSVAGDKREHLLALFEQLKLALNQTPASYNEQAEIVADQAKDISEELKRSKPREAALKIKGSSLVEAAKALSSVVPTAIEVAKQIAEFITNLSG